MTSFDDDDDDDDDDDVALTFSLSSNKTIDSIG
jgi:hypothetical protein